MARLEKEGNEIMDLSKNHEKRNEEKDEEKHMKAELEKWANKRRLEREGDEIVEVMRRHEEKEEEQEEKGRHGGKRRQEKGKRRKEAEARTTIAAAREKGERITPGFRGSHEKRPEVTAEAANATTKRRANTARRMSKRRER